MVQYSKDVLNAGYVRLLEHMGGDQAVVRNARRCWQSEDKATPESDARLIRHLLNLRHMSPFEAMVFTFDVQAPIFVARQWLRHRMGSPMELSLRYCVADNKYYIPHNLEPEILQQWVGMHDMLFATYNRWINEGVKREQARSILPLGTYTKFYYTVNGSSLINFLRLRTAPGAQWEMRQYAFAVLDLVEQVAPITFGEVRRRLEDNSL